MKGYQEFLNELHAKSSTVVENHRDSAVSFNEKEESGEGDSEIGKIVAAISKLDGLGKAFIKGMTDDAMVDVQAAKFAQQAKSGKVDKAAVEKFREAAKQKKAQAKQVAEAAKKQMQEITDSVSSKWVATKAASIQTLGELKKADVLLKVAEGEKKSSIASKMKELQSTFSKQSEKLKELQEKNAGLVERAKLEKGIKDKEEELDGINKEIQELEAKTNWKPEGAKESLNPLEEAKSPETLEALSKLYMEKMKVLEELIKMKEEFNAALPDDSKGDAKSTEGDKKALEGAKKAQTANTLSSQASLKATGVSPGDMKDLKKSQAEVIKKRQSLKDAQDELKKSKDSEDAQKAVEDAKKSLADAQAKSKEIENKIKGGKKNESATMSFSAFLEHLERND
jgi:hypothetical protein